MTRQRRSMNVIWIIGVLCALVVPPIAVGLYVTATAMLLVLPIIYARRAWGRTSSPDDAVD